MKSVIALALIPSLLFCPVSVIGNEHPPLGSREMIRDCHEGYTFMWWAYGWRGAKIRCLQTSTYGMAMDVKGMSVPHFGTIADPAPYEQAVAQSNDVVFRMPAAEMELSVEARGRRYVCVSGGHPRLIESGRFLQRSDVEGLVFKNQDGEVLPADCRLEIVAWPDWLSFILDVTPREDMKAARAAIRFRAKAGSVEESSAALDWLSGETQTVSAVLGTQPSGGNTSKNGSIVRACSHGDSRALPVSYDPARGWYKVEIPAESGEKPNAASLQRIRVHLRNPATKPRVVRVNFARDGNVPAITGLVPLLRDAQQNPIGIPVQISKNWHRREGKTFLYEGSWLHALTMLRIPGRFEGELEFCISRNLWGEVPLASHAQLCLIGWGTDQLWDQAAIGSWGESICYDPDVCLQRSVIDDIRPLMVTQMNSTNGKWGWSNNVGGGDFLVYYNESNRKQFLSGMRTAYLSQGPNLTDVIYAGTSADGNIAVSLRVMTPRCDDINRAYHTFRYDVLKPTRFKRLAFYQLGADNYNDHQFRKLARGNETGMLEEWDAPRDGRLGYHRRGIPCSGRMPWFSLHGAVSKDKKGGAWANRGLVVRCWEARLGGSDSPPFAACYGTKNGPSSCNIELAPPPGLTELRPGDFVEATVELLVLPQFAKDYYGPNEKLRQDLEANENTWKPVLRQAAHGALAVSVSKGELLQSCPVRIEVDSSQEAEFVVTGGVGYSPITFTGLSDYRGWKLQHRASGTWSVIDQSVFGSDFWQIDATADGRFTITFNVLLDAGTGVQRFRLTKGDVAAEDTTLVVSYPAPSGEELSDDYEVSASGKDVAVYRARVLNPPFADKQWDFGGPYSFANFDMAGRVTVRIKSRRSLGNTIIRPRSYGLAYTLENDHTLVLILDRPRKISIEPDGKKGPLLLFANPLEPKQPNAGDAGVLYYGPGVHRPERIVVQSNQTLYLAGGSLVKAEVLVRGNNIRIRGRGILDGSEWAWRSGPVGNLIAIRDSTDVEVSGLTLRGASHWTIVPKSCKNVTIRNVKLCNSRVQNDDGINPCNSQDVLITDCFIRSDDDCVALKGLNLHERNNNVENIVVENSTLWCDRARIFLLGHESRAAFMRNATLRNLDIIHYSMTPFLLEPGEDMRMEDITVETIRINGEGQRVFIRLRPVVNQYMHKKVPGHIRNVRFTNIAVQGDWPSRSIQTSRKPPPGQITKPTPFGFSGR